MGYEAERAEEDYWADPENAIREAALDTGSGESWVDGGMVGHDAEEDLTDLGERPQDPAADARYLRGIGYWNMTPAQRAGWANEMLVKYTTSPKEGPKMYDMDDMGALDQAEALETARRRWALENVYGGMADNPRTPMPTDQELLDVFGGRDKPFTLAGTKARQERKARILLGRYEPVGKDTPEKEERIRVARLLNRINGVMGGWGVGQDPAKEAAATVEELERLRDWAAARLEHITRYPAEPELSDGPCVVTFTRTYRGRAYTYAALRVPSGVQAGTWVVTGPKSPAYVSWEELMAWVETGTPSDQSMVIATVDSWVLES